MKNTLWLLLGILLVLLPKTVAVADQNCVSQEIVLTPAQHIVVARLIATDAEAGAIYKAIVNRANASLTDTPNPVEVVQTEGKLMGDPVKTRTLESLRDMQKMSDLAWAGSFASAQKASAYFAATKLFLLAWARVNHSDGDPIDDTHLELALTAYDLSRKSFSADESAQVEQWFRQAAAAEERTGHWSTSPRWNNWNSHRLKIVGLIAFLLGDTAMQARVEAAYQDQIDHNLNADGTTYDFRERDALHYHVYDLEPLLTLAIAARCNSVDLFDETGTGAGALSKSLDFLVPFCDGTKTQPEFVHSKVSFDRKRASNGESKYISGHLCEPTEAVNVLSLGAAFDPKYAIVEHSLQTPHPLRFGTWQDVLDSAQAR